MGSQKNVDQILYTSAPVDYSFRNIATLNVGRMPPGAFRVGRVPILGATHRYLTRSVWLSNNHLKHMTNIQDFINKFLEQPEALGWIDFSYNNITEIDEEILSFPNLVILYLHSNGIKTLSTIAKLKKLTKLKTLTLHGNPIDIIPMYRRYIVALLPQLRSLDFVVVVSSDRHLHTSPRSYGSYIIKQYSK